MKNNKVILAFSGGLDTSFCIPYLINEKGLEVHTVIVNSGGFSNEEMDEIEKRALSLGATTHQGISITNSFYRDGIRFLIYGNVLRGGVYPLSVGAERVFQALEIVKKVKELDAAYVAHGSTGAGNDQVRFDLLFNILSPETTILAPVRELSLSRQEEVDYLKKHGVELEWSKAKYSINQGLWGTTIGGAETLTSHRHVPEEAYPSKVKESEPQIVKIGFKKGEPSSLDGVEQSPVELIEKLNKLGERYAVGRDIHLGDSIVGLKGRVAFEAPAALMLIKAHQLLEKHTLTQEQLILKETLANRYGELMHQGRYLEPAMRNIESFLEGSQLHVTGEVEIELSPYRFTLLGCDSPYDLMKGQRGDYGEMNSAVTAADISGFIKVSATQLTNYYTIHNYD